MFLLEEWPALTDLILRSYFSTMLVLAGLVPPDMIRTDAYLAKANSKIELKGLNAWGILLTILYFDRRMSDDWKRAQISSLNRIIENPDVTLRLLLDPLVIFGRQKAIAVNHAYRLMLEFHSIPCMLDGAVQQPTEVVPARN